MKFFIIFITLASMILTGCNTGENSTSYSTILGDITIVDNGGTNTTTKTNSADVDAAKELQNNIEKKADNQLEAKAASMNK